MSRTLHLNAITRRLVVGLHDVEGIVTLVNSLVWFLLEAYI